MDLDDFRKASVNIINGIISSILALLTLVFIVIGYYLYQIDNNQKSKEEKAANNLVCGTTGRLKEIRSIHNTIKIEHANLDLGKTLFRNNCATCHSKNMKDDLTGPALGGVTERWENYPNNDLFKFIRNSQEMIKSGHPRAVKLWTKWKPTIMNSFEDLTDEEIVAIIAYIEY